MPDTIDTLVTLLNLGFPNCCITIGKSKDNTQDKLILSDDCAFVLSNNDLLPLIQEGLSFEHNYLFKEKLPNFIFNIALKQEKNIQEQLGHILAFEPEDTLNLIYNLLENDFDTNIEQKYEHILCLLKDNYLNCIHPNVINNLYYEQCDNFEEAYQFYRTYTLTCIIEEIANFDISITPALSHYLARQEEHMHFSRFHQLANSIASHYPLEPFSHLKCIHLLNQAQNTDSFWYSQTFDLIINIDLNQVQLHYRDNCYQIQEYIKICEFFADALLQENDLGIAHISVSENRTYQIHQYAQYQINLKPDTRLNEKIFKTLFLKTFHYLHTNENYNDFNDSDNITQLLKKSLSDYVSLHAFNVYLDQSLVEKPSNTQLNKI